MAEVKGEYYADICTKLKEIDDKNELPLLHIINVALETPRVQTGSYIVDHQI